MKYEIKLARPDKTFVTSYVDAKTEEQAKNKAISTAKTIAKRPNNSNVILSGVPLKFEKVEPWEDCKLKVIKGSKLFNVLLVSKDEVMESMVFAAGVKSAYAYAIKKSGLLGEIRAFVFNTEQNSNWQILYSSDVRKKHIMCNVCNKEKTDNFTLKAILQFGSYQGMDLEAFCTCDENTKKIIKEETERVKEEVLKWKKEREEEKELFRLEPLKALIYDSVRKCYGVTMVRNLTRKETEDFRKQGMNYKFWSDSSIYDIEEDLFTLNRKSDGYTVFGYEVWVLSIEEDKKLEQMQAESKKSKKN